MKPEATRDGRPAPTVRAAWHPRQWPRAIGGLREGPLQALSFPDYARLWQANLTSGIGFWMQSVAQGWLVVEITDSPFTLGLLAFFRSLPMAIISPFGGVLADRVDRIRLVLIAQIMLVGTALAIGILALDLERVEMWHLAVAALLLGTTFAISVPARNAALSDIVPRRVLANAVALQSTTQNGSRMVGPALAGFLVGVIGIAGTYFMQVGLFVWSLINVLRIGRDRARARAVGSPLRNLRDGFVYVRETKPVLGLVLLSLAPAVFGMPVIWLLPAYVKHELLGGASDLGILMGAFGLGAVAGSVAAVAAANVSRKAALMIVAALLHGLFLATLALTRSMAVGALVLALAGAFQAIQIATKLTLIQLITPRHLRGRMISMLMITWGLSPLGLLPLSAVAESISTPVAIGAGGVLSMATVVAVLAWAPELWRLRLDPAASADPEPASDRAS